MAESSGKKRIDTPVSLLSRLRDWEDAEAWAEFEEIYHDLLRRFVLKTGVDENGVEEVVQETLVRVAKAIGTFKYNPERCTFMSWLLLLTHSRVVEYKRRQSRQPAKAGADPALLDAVPDEAAVELYRVWEEEWRGRLLAIAERRVKKANPRQWQIYELYMKRKLPVKEVQAKLGLSAQQVYLARTRVVKMLRDEVGRLAMEDGNE